MEDGTARCVGIWNQMVPTVLIPRLDGDLYSAIIQAEGEIGNYIGGTDNGESYRLVYESGWIDITRSNYLLILKRLNGLFFFNIDTDVYMKWAFDFSTNFYTRQLQFTIGGGTAQVLRTFVASRALDWKLPQARAGVRPEPSDKAAMAAE